MLHLWLSSAINYLSTISALCDAVKQAPKTGLAVEPEVDRDGDERNRQRDEGAEQVVGGVAADAQGVSGCSFVGGSGSVGGALGAATFPGRSICSLPQRRKPGLGVGTVATNFGDIVETLRVGDALEQRPAGLGHIGAEAPLHQLGRYVALTPESLSSRLLDSLLNSLLDALLDPFADADPLDAGDVRHVLCRFAGLDLGPELP